MSILRGCRLKIKLLRWGVQASAFVVSDIGFNVALKTGCVYPFLHCYACPFATAGCPIGLLQHFVILRALPLYLIGVVAVAGLLLGRAYCGWGCPFGSFHDLLSKPARTKARKIPLAKYAMLLLIILLAWITSDTFFCKFCPSGSLFGAVPAPFFYEGVRLGFFFNVHLVTLALTIGLALVVSRFWCRYLCPFGTIGIFNRISIVTISADASKCTQCKACLTRCPMGIQKVEEIGRSSDCILCGRCVEACATKALKYSFRPSVNDK